MMNAAMPWAAEPPAFSYLAVIRVLISCGADVNHLRDIARDCLGRLTQMLDDDLKANLILREWDYRYDAPTDVPAGHLADRSLEMVDHADAVLAILGARVPEVTSREIHRVYEAREGGQPKLLWLFLNPAERGADHDHLIATVRDEFGVDIIWTPYTSDMDFQAKVFTTLVPYLVRRTSTGFGPGGSVDV